jgi:hypothetical protein
MGSLKQAIETFVERLVGAVVPALQEAAETAAAELSEALSQATIADIGELTGGGVSRSARRAPSRGNGRRKPAGGKRGRMPRRSMDEIMAVVGKVAKLLRSHKAGLRAEDIRTVLNMDRREMPRVLRAAVSEGAIKVISGQKRSTAYGVGGARKSAKPRKARAASKKRAAKAKTTPKKRTAKATSKKTPKAAPRRAAAQKPRPKAKARAKAKAAPKAKPEAAANGIATPTGAI